MSRRPSPLLIAFALLALSWAQVFGIMRGYLCDCHGVAQITAYDHCHGDDDQCCHEDEPASHSHEDHDEDDGGAHQHEPVKESVQARTIATTSVATSAPVLALFILPEFVTGFDLAQLAMLSPTPPPRLAELHRRWPRVLTRSVAMRI
jgi:hypothetical protein